MTEGVRWVCGLYSRASGACRSCVLIASRGGKMSVNMVVRAVRWLRFLTILSYAFSFLAPLPVCVSFLRVCLLAVCPWRLSINTH